MIRQKQPLLHLLVLAVFFSTTLAFAQDAALPDTLEPITANNIDRLHEIANLSPMFWGGFWSSDGQSYYANLNDGLYRYDLNDPEHPVAVPEASVPTPPPHYRRTFDLALPVALSPDLSMGAYIVQPDDPEARQAEVRIAKMSDGSEVAHVMTDSPLVPQRYSDDMVLPQFSRTGLLLYLRENDLYQWNPVTKQEALILSAHDGDKFKFSDIRLNPQGTYAATYFVGGSVSTSNTFTLYNLRTTPARPVFQRTFPPVDRWTSIAISPDGQFVAAGGGNANIRVWNIQQGTDSFHEDYPPNEYGDASVVDLTYIPNGRFIAGAVASVSGGFAFVRNAQTGEEVAHIRRDNSIPGETFSSVAINPAGDRIAFGTNAGTVILWPFDDLLNAKDVNQVDAPIVLAGTTQPISDVNFNADGTQLVAASLDNMVRVWDIATQQIVATFNTPDKARSAVFSPSGKTVATASNNGSILMWNIQSQQSRLIDQLPKPDENSWPAISELTFSPDGSLLAGAGNLGGIYIWNIETGQQHIFQAERKNWSLAFSHDGRFFAAANSSDTTIRLWGVPVTENP